TAPTKFTSDGVLTLVTQSERAALAYVKTVASITSPITKRLPSIPTLLSPAEAKGVLDNGYAAWSTLLDTNKAFATDLLDGPTPSASPPTPSSSRPACSPRTATARPHRRTTRPRPPFAPTRVSRRRRRRRS